MEIISLSGHTQVSQNHFVVLLTHVQQADGRPSGTETGRQRADFSLKPFECVVKLVLKNVRKYASFHFISVKYRFVCVFLSAHMELSLNVSQVL